MKIGINPLSWSNDDLPSLGGETSLDQCLSEGKAVGFQGFELGNKFPREPQSLKKALSQYDLELASGWFSGGVYNHTAQQEIERLKPHCELLSYCDAKVIVYCDTTGSVQGQAMTPLSYRPKIPEDQWESFCDKLSAVSQWTQEQGLAIAYHYHMGTLIQSDEDIDRMMANTCDDVGLLVDVGHAAFAEADPLAITKKHLNRIRHVHLKDVCLNLMHSLLNCDSSFIDAVLAGVFTVPGDGDLPIDQVVKILINGGYNDWLIVEAEQDPAVAPTMPMVTKAHQYMTELLN